MISTWSLGDVLNIVYGEIRRYGGRCRRGSTARCRSPGRKWSRYYIIGTVTNTCSAVDRKPYEVISKAAGIYVRVIHIAAVITEIIAKSDILTKSVDFQPDVVPISAAT